jgi:RES domain-containing protein
MAPLPAEWVGAGAGASAGAGAGAAPQPLRAWRIDAEPFAATWDSGLGAERFGGRWNPKGLRAVYCSLDPATCLVEAAVHRGFDVLDTRPHVLSCVQIAPLSPADPGVRVVLSDELPNPAWLQGGTPGAGQQRFGADLLAAHGVIVLPSAVSKCSWNLVFSPDVAAGRIRLLHQQRLVVDTRLNPAPGRPR